MGAEMPCAWCNTSPCCCPPGEGRHANREVRIQEPRVETRGGGEITIPNKKPFIPSGMCSCETPGMTRCDNSGCRCTRCGKLARRFKSEPGEPEEWEVLSGEQAVSANTRQVGGEHYKTDYQHWDFAEHVGLGYLEGCATKYVSRWRKKNGMEDLKKAEHYLDKLLEIMQSGVRYSRAYGGNVKRQDALRFCMANDLDPQESSIILLLSGDFREAEVRQARQILGALITRVEEDQFCEQIGV